MNAVLTGFSNQLLLSQIWVKLNLEHGRLDLGVVKNLLDLVGSDVAEADVADKAVSHELLHGLPCLLIGDTSVEFHFWGCAIDRSGPLGRICGLNRNEGLMDWEVNQV